MDDELEVPKVKMASLLGIVRAEPNDPARKPRKVVRVGVDVGHGRWAEVERKGGIDALVREIHTKLARLGLMEYVESLLQLNVGFREP